MSDERRMLLLSMHSQKSSIPFIYVMRRREGGRIYFPLPSFEVIVGSIINHSDHF
jgi:hypothetical protein